VQPPATSHPAKHCDYLIRERIIGTWFSGHSTYRESASGTRTLASRNNPQLNPSITGTTLSINTNTKLDIDQSHSIKINNPKGRTVQQRKINSKRKSNKSNLIVS